MGVTVTPPVLSVVVTLKLYVPATSNVLSLTVIAPVMALMATPAGNEPVVTIALVIAPFASVTVARDSPLT